MTTTIKNTDRFGKHSLDLAMATFCGTCPRKNWDDCRVGNSPGLYSLPERKQKICARVKFLAQELSEVADKHRADEGMDVSKLARM